MWTHDDGASEVRLVSARSGDDRSFANQHHRLVAFPKVDQHYQNSIARVFPDGSIRDQTTCSLMALTHVAEEREQWSKRKATRRCRKLKGSNVGAGLNRVVHPTLTLTTARTYSRCSTRRTEQSTSTPKNQKRTPRPSDRTNPYPHVRSTPPRGHRGRFVDPRPHTTRRRSTPRATRHRQRRARESLRKKKDIEKHIKLIAHTKIERN